MKKLIINIFFTLCCIINLIGQHKVIFNGQQIVCNTNHESASDFNVYTLASFLKNGALYPITGNTKINSENGYIEFTPFVQFSFDTKLLVICSGIEHQISIPIPADYVYPTVENIYPSIKNWPANTLKFYVKFSKPMSQIAYPNIYIQNSKGENIERAILKEIPELWNDDYTLLTVWLEPGRIKRNLGPNKALGEIFKEGETYSIFIDQKLKDKNGVKLIAPFSSSFTAITEDRSMIESHKWKINAPQKFSTQPLIIEFEESLDYGSLQDRFIIINEHEKHIQGTWITLQSTEGLSFIPLTQWSPGVYQLIISSKIEDLAGNRTYRLFDQPILDNGNNFPAEKPGYIEFEIKQ